jgi:hypothetical protein
MTHGFTAIAIAVVTINPQVQASDPPSPMLSVGGLVFWIGQTEEDARKGIPTGYRSEPTDGGWTLRARSASAQPYLINLSVAKGHVARVSFNWPVGSNLRMDAYSALLADAFSHVESCRLISAANEGVGIITRRMEFGCGARRLTSIVGDWPMGATATITLE